MIINKSDKDSVQKTAQVLRNGGICILPTDTVYGFSGLVATKEILPESSTDAEIRRIKGRSETKPLICLIAKPEDLALYTNDSIPQELLSKWPGALTIIVHTKEDAPLAPQAKLPTIAFRCPGDQWIRQVIEELGAPIYSTSVNRSGQPVLEEEGAIVEEFQNEVSLIVNDGDKKGALPSTLVSLEKGQVKIIRQGSVKIN
ncbi:MAG: threonylcarbamoyl-AMP synthase [Treponema sp.]|nr:threonylcarbamoyl-AMP synthase [Treponema sp.]